MPAGLARVRHSLHGRMVDSATSIHTHTYTQQPSHITHSISRQPAATTDRTGLAPETGPSSNHVLSKIGKILIFTPLRSLLSFFLSSKISLTRRRRSCSSFSLFLTGEGPFSCLSDEKKNQQHNSSIYKQQQNNTSTFLTNKKNSRFILKMKPKSSFFSLEFLP